MPSVVSAKFEDLVAIGLGVLIGDDPNLELVAEGVPHDEIEAAIERHSPSVVLLNFGTLRAPAQVYQLHQAYPDTRIVVLANRPTAAECNQMLSFGATACLSKETEARDIVNAIHLASRGMHVLPRSAASGGRPEYDGRGGRAAHAARGRGARAADRREDERADRAAAHDRHRDRADARAQHLPEARNQLAPRARQPSLAALLYSMENMGKTWVLDTETKGTGANMVPLEKVLKKPDSEEEPARARRPRQRSQD